MSAYQNLQNAFSDVLNDLISMSADVIRKSSVYLRDVQALDAKNVENISKDLKILLEKISSNVDSFMQTTDLAFNKYELEKNPQPPKRLNLSLKKERESEIDLTCSDEEIAITQKSTLEIKDQESSSRSDDTESLEKDESSTPNEDYKIEIVKENNGDGIDKKNPKTETDKTLQTFESMSFDFDDLDDTDTAKAVVDCLEKQVDTKNTTHELLQLLEKAANNFKCKSSENQSFEETEAEEALKMLDDEISISSDTDSSFSWPSISDDEEIHDKNEFNDEESETEKEPDFIPKEFHINLDKRLDQLDDDEIDRLCNIHNINKRKCMKEIRTFRKKKVKRRKILFISSSDSSSDSETPDLSIDPDGSLTSQSNQPFDNSLLADHLAEELDKDSERESSTDDELEDKTEESENKKKPNENDEMKKCDPEKEDEGNEDETKKKEKLRGSWRTNLLWTDTEDEEDEILLLEKEITEISDEAEPLVIDSEKSDDDDVTFVEETINDDSISNGRRNIRAILNDHELNELTKLAKNEEDERIKRLEEHTQTIESIQSQREEFILDLDVNTGHPLITVDDHLTRKLKPHQKEGVQFMWQACYESIKNIKEKKKATGCILAHCMGLGKTLQVITLVHTLFKHKETSTKHVLIICPLSTIINWRNEFRINLRKPWGFYLYLTTGEFQNKVEVVRNWRRSGGILIMNYETFSNLTIKLNDRVSEQRKQELIEALLDPGPDLVVCDEGHQLKNSQTYKTKALMQIKTQRRIVMTGTPLQNNLTEYYTMVEFVKPHLLGTFAEYKNRFGTPIKNGQFHNSKPEDIKLMKKRTHVLTKLLKNTIHRAESSILAHYLPEIKDNSLFIKLSPLQLQIYKQYIQIVTTRTCDLSKGFLQDVMVMGFNNLHPYTLFLYYNKPKPKKKSKKKLDDVSNDDEQTCDILNHVSKDWYKELIPEDVATNIEYSFKLKTLLNLVDETVNLGEKLLIFSQYLVELDVIEHFLKVHSKENNQEWRPNVDYFRMDGSTLVATRNTLCESFNTNPNAKVFLLTHRVGGLGLNLTGANRVIMIGSNHNPSLDTQSMYRVYRFGQTRECFVYRLLSLATMEEKIYHRCVVKLLLSGTVVDKLHFARTYASSDLEEMYTLDFSEYEKERPMPALPADKLLAKLLLNITDIYTYHSQKSLLEHKPEEELTDEDKRLAWDEFNNIEAAKVAQLPILAPVINPVRLSMFTTKSTIPTTIANSPNFVRNPLLNFTRHYTPSNMPPPNARINNPPMPLYAISTPVNRQMFNNPASDHLRLAVETLKNSASSSKHPNAESSSSNTEFNYALNKVI